MLLQLRGNGIPGLRPMSRLSNDRLVSDVISIVQGRLRLSLLLAAVPLRRRYLLKAV